MCSIDDTCAKNSIWPLKITESSQATDFHFLMSWTRICLCVANLHVRCFHSTCVPFKLWLVYCTLVSFLQTWSPNIVSINANYFDWFGVLFYITTHFSIRYWHTVNMSLLKHADKNIYQVVSHLLILNLLQDFFCHN